MLAARSIRGKESELLMKKSSSVVLPIIGGLSLVRL